MTLREWMDRTNTDMLATAKLFDASIHAVRKWLRGDRTPRPATQAKIKKLTDGLVTGDDWINGR